MSVYKTGTVDINNSTTTKLNNGKRLLGHILMCLGMKR